LNPIEHLWIDLKKRIKNRKNPPTSKNELWSVIEEEWNNTSPDFCNKLIDTIP
jgi:transposase